MKPGELRRFSDSLMAFGTDHFEGRTFMVLAVTAEAEAVGMYEVDILIDGRHETDLGYLWVRDSSELLEPV